MIISKGTEQAFDKNAIAHSFLKEVVLTCLLENLGFFFFSEFLFKAREGASPFELLTF